MSSVIPYDALQGVYAMLNNNVEMCGILIQKGAYLYPYVDAVGEESKGRNLCIHPRYSTYIWHTHAMTMKGYPSPEDIIKIIKARKVYIKSTLIFTSWGIWEIWCKNKVNVTNDMHVYLVSKLSPMWNGIYHITDRGRKLSSRVIPFINSVIYETTTFLNHKFERGNLGIEISFIPWNRIGRKGYKINN